MIALGRGFVICALAALLAGCGAPVLFEDVGDDPHPPEFTLLGVAIQPPGEPPPLPDFLPPGTTLTVRPFDEASNRIALLGEFRDDGGDADVIVIRDLGIGTSGGEGTPLGSVRRLSGRSAVPRGAGGEADLSGDPVGTSGRVWVVYDVPVSVQGLHRFEVWVEDTKGSRSGKTTFTVNVQLF